MELTTQIQLETDLMDTETVDGFADVGTPIIAFQLVDGQRKSLATNAISVPELCHPFPVLDVEIRNMKTTPLLPTRTSWSPYSIPFDEWFRISANGAN